MKQTTPINIDTALNFSAYRFFCLLFATLFWFLLVWQLALSFWYGVVLGVAWLGCLTVAQLKQPHLTALSSTHTPSFSDNPQDFLLWQIQIFEGYLVVPYGYETDIYQATLQKIDDFGVVLLLDFGVFEPFDGHFTVQIWQDQVDKESWRQLKILAKMQ